VKNVALIKSSAKIKIRVFFEIMGWPKEHLNDALSKTLDTMENKLKWKILKKTFEEPSQIGKKMFTSHVEFEAEAPNLGELFTFVLAFGPSVVEILDPPEMYLNAGEVQDILSDICSKVLQMDKDIKVLAAENKQYMALIEKLKERGILKEMTPNDKKSPK